MIRTNAKGNTNHDKCMQKDKCVGPGCKVKTGKTARIRERKAASNETV